MHDQPLEVGDQVEVHTTFNDTWVPGFEIAELIPRGYRVRRVLDGSLLPGYTSDSDVRRAAGSVQWPRGTGSAPRSPR